jgi:hypothetical protein
MANQMPMNFDMPQENINALYSYSDVREGTGFITYYASEYGDESATSYVLDTELSYSQSIEVDTGTYDFYTPTFNVPKIIEGDALLNACIYAHSPGGDSATCKITVKFYHYDGTTSTQIGSTWVSTEHSVGGVDIGTPKSINGRITLPLTNFRIGDQLRVEVVFSGSAYGTKRMGLDPQNRDGGIPGIHASAGGFTQFIVRVPHKVDV